MKLDQSLDDTATKVINLVGFSLVILAAIAGFLYFGRTGGHPLRDLSSLLVIVALLLAFNLAGRKGRPKTPPEPT